MLRHSSIGPLFRGFAFLILSCTTLVSAQQDQTATPAQGAAPAVKSPPKAPTDEKKTSPPTGPADPVFDVMSAKFTSQDACLLFDPEVLKDKAKSRIERLRTEIENIQSDGTISGWSKTELSAAVGNDKECPECIQAVGKPSDKKSDAIVIFHVVTWKKPTTAQSGNKVTVPISSEWHAYQLKGLDTLKPTGIGSDGEPRIYNKKKVVLVGVDWFSDPNATGPVVDAYTSSATPGTPQNQTDLAALITALTGVSAPSALQPQVAGKVSFDCRKIAIAAGLQPGTARLPFDVKVTVASSDQYDDSSKTAGQATGDISSAEDDCTASSCVQLKLSSTPAVLVSVSGAYKGTLQFEMSPDTKKYSIATAFPALGGAGATSTTSSGKWVVLTPAMASLRVRASNLAAGSGSPQVSLQPLSKPAAPPSVAKGTITSAGTDCTPSSSCVPLDLSDIPSVVVSVSGDYAGALEFEASPDGANFVAVEGYSTLSGNHRTNKGTSGEWVIPTAGMSEARVRASALSSGTPRIALQPIAKSITDSSSKDQTQAKSPASEPSPGTMSCTGSQNSLPCTTTRTFTSLDPEWWDVSVGIAIPGVRESKYSITNNAVVKSVTTHTDLYAMLDLYPFFLKAGKNDWAPHFNLGVPLTSQSFYRPYFGLAESVGGILSRVSGAKRPFKLPVDINVFAGMVWMKTNFVTDNPTTTQQLASDSHQTRVWKPVFGIEVPVSSIASKIKGAASKNSNGSASSKSGTAGAGGN